MGPDPRGPGALGPVRAHIDGDGEEDGGIAEFPKCAQSELPKRQI